MGDPVSGNRPPPPPPPSSSTSGGSTAREIVKNLFEGDKAKQLTQEQQLQQLQESARTQETLRGAATETKDRGDAADAAHRETSAREAHRPPPEPVVSRRESAMDSFLQRSSQLQQARDAGRDMNKPTLGSMTAQAWSVGGSPHTSDAARGMIAQRQPNNPPNPPPPRSEAGGRLPLAHTLTRPMPGSAFADRTPAMPATALLIRYASAFQSGGETSARAFQGRNLASENLARQLGRMITDAQAQHPGAGENPNVMVHIRGPLIFVRDGDKLRAFRLNPDGSLNELPGEDAGDHPLSPEAQALLRKVLRQRGPQTKMDGGGADHLGHLSAEELAELKAQEAEADSEAQPEGELDFETRFALLLHAVLEEDQVIGKKLKEGEDPNFPIKGSWETFFANLLGMGNQEKANKKNLDDVLGMIFRGLFSKKGAGNTLVGDMKYLMDGKTKEEKFAQVQILDAKLLELLGELKPGQRIDKELLQKYFGDELSYLQMAHVSERLYNMASGAEKNVVFNPKLSYDAFSQARLERQLFATRTPPKTATAADADASGGHVPLDLGKHGFFANVYEQVGMRERYKGKPKLYTLIAYTVMLAAAGLIAVFVLKAL